MGVTGGYWPVLEGRLTSLFARTPWPRDPQFSPSRAENAGSIPVTRSTGTRSSEALLGDLGPAGLRRLRAPPLINQHVTQDRDHETADTLNGMIEAKLSSARRERMARRRSRQLARHPRGASGQTDPTTPTISSIHGSPDRARDRA